MAADWLEPYRADALQWQGLLLFAANVALTFLNDCEVKGLRLSGCQAFEQRHDGSIKRLSFEDLDALGKEYWDYSVGELCEVFRDHIRPRSRMLFAFELP